MNENVERTKGMAKRNDELHYKVGLLLQNQKQDQIMMMIGISEHDPTDVFNITITRLVDLR